MSAAEPRRGDSLLLPTKSPGILVLIRSTSEEWEAELTLEPPGDLKLGPLGLSSALQKVKLESKYGRNLRKVAPLRVDYNVGLFSCLKGNV